MSLLQLLTTGKSLVGLQDEGTRYRVTQQRLLPRFGPARNPFCAAVTAHSASPEVRRVGAAAPAPSWQQAPRVVATPPPVPPASSGRGHVKSGLRSAAIALRDKWSGKLGAMLSRPGVKPLKAAAPGPARVAVQGELALDRITVVRNDLSDADLEVVPAKPIAVQQSMVSARPAQSAGGSGSAAWGRVSAIFRADKA